MPVAISITYFIHNFQLWYAKPVRLSVLVTLPDFRASTLCPALCMAYPSHGTGTTSIYEGRALAIYDVRWWSTYAYCFRIWQAQLVVIHQANLLVTPRTTALPCAWSVGHCQEVSGINTPQLRNYRTIERGKLAEQVSAISDIHTYVSHASHLTEIDRLVYNYTWSTELIVNPVITSDTVAWLAISIE